MTQVVVKQGGSARVVIGRTENESGDAIDLTDSLVQVMVKASHRLPDSSAVLQYWLDTDGAGGSTATPVGRIRRGRPDPMDATILIDTEVDSGYLTVEFTDEDTTQTVINRYQYEVVIYTRADDRVYFVDEGTVTIRRGLIRDPKAAPA